MLCAVYLGHGFVHQEKRTIYLSFCVGCKALRMTELRLKQMHRYRSMRHTSNTRVAMLPSYPQPAQHSRFRYFTTVFDNGRCVPRCTLDTANANRDTCLPYANEGSSHSNITQVFVGVFWEEQPTSGTPTPVLWTNDLELE